MRRFQILTAVMTAISVPVALGTPADAAASAPTVQHAELVALHFGGGSRRGFGGGGLLGRRRVRSHPILRRVAHALVFAYIVHLLFSHGGVSIVIWLIVIGLVAHLVHRGRRRRFVY